MRIVKCNALTDDFFEYKDSITSARVKKILRDVKINGDRTLVKYTRLFDNVSLKSIRVDPGEIARAYKRTDREFLRAVSIAAQNIEKFCRRQHARLSGFREQIVTGVIAEQRIVPIDRIGIYVPAGRHPLVSTLLMCAIPAQVAGVKEMAICSPPVCKGRTVHPSILAAAWFLGLREIYKVGGAQAIAAMAYGTESVKKVDSRAPG